MNKDEIKDALLALIAEEAGIDIVSSYPSLNIVYIKGNVEKLRVVRTCKGNCATS